jgi:potassium-dependent mechanosensitive channel
VDLPARAVKILFYPLLTLSGTPVTLASIFIAVTIFAASRLGARLASLAIRRGLRSRNQPDGVAAAVSQITRYVIVFIGLAVALNTVGININALLAGSAVLLVGVGLGLQNITSNFISGIIVLFERPVKRGDVIQLGDVTGTVRDIGLRTTKIVTRDEVMYLIPNNELTSTKVVNLSMPTSKLRLRVRVSVAYDSDTTLVHETLLEIASAHPDVLAEPPPDVRLENFGDSSLDFALLCWIAEPPADDEVASDLRLAILAAFRERGVAIPFPQRDLHIRAAAPARSAEAPRTAAQPTPLA